MKIFQRVNILVVLLTLTAAKCELPDVSQYADLTKDMSQSVQQTATRTVDLLDQGFYARKGSSESGIDEAIAGDLNEILGRKPVDLTKDYPALLRKDWKKIFRTLEQLVSYADALAAIRESGTQGKASFNNLANALGGLASAAGFGTISAPVQDAGKFIYGKIAEIKASKRLNDVIVKSDTVIQLIALRLDDAIGNMGEVNDVAESENLINVAHSKDNERIANYYMSLVEKENANIDKLTLINTYDNGDRSALLFFVYRDPQSLDKLGIKDLQEVIRRIQDTGILSPKQKLDSIAAVVQLRFKTQVDAALNNSVIVNTIRISQRLRDIQADLEFVRSEREKYQERYDAINTLDVNIRTAAALNRELIDKSRKAVKTWATQHSNLVDFFSKKQKLSFATLKQYVDDIKELGSIVKEFKR